MHSVLLAKIVCTRKIYDIEKAVVTKYFKPVLNIVVPNVSHSFFSFHEADLISLSQAGYATEVEIKTNRADLIADKKRVGGIPSQPETAHYPN